MTCKAERLLCRLRLDESMPLARVSDLADGMYILLMDVLTWLAFRMSRLGAVWR